MMRLGGGGGHPIRGSWIVCPKNTFWQAITHSSQQHTSLQIGPIRHSCIFLQSITLRPYRTWKCKNVSESPFLQFRKSMERQTPKCFVITPFWCTGRFLPGRHQKSSWYPQAFPNDFSFQLTFLSFDSK